jgi:hypothetical protein
MKITITATDQITKIDGVLVRVWDGITEGGVACKVLVHRLVVAPGANAAEFERALQEELPPGRVIDLRYVL